MKKSLIAFSLVISSFCLCNPVQEQRLALLSQVEREAKHLIWHTADLQPSQLQFLLNYCAASYALVLVELKFAQESRFITCMSWHMRYNPEEPMVDSQKVALLERSFVRARNLLISRNTLRKAVACLSSELEKKVDNNPRSIIETIARHSTQLVSQFSKQEQSSISEALAEVHTKLVAAGSFVVMGGNTFDALYKGEYPLPQSTENSCLETIETAMKLLPSLGQQNYAILQALEGVAKKIEDIQAFGALTFYLYYIVLYKGMQERGIKSSYFKVLFKNNTVIKANPQHKQFDEQPFVDANIPLLDH